MGFSPQLLPAPGLLLVDEGMSKDLLLFGCIADRDITGSITVQILCPFLCLSVCVSVFMSLWACVRMSLTWCHVWRLIRMIRSFPTSRKSRICPPHGQDWKVKAHYYKNEQCTVIGECIADKNSHITVLKLGVPPSVNFIKKIQPSLTPWYHDVGSFAYIVDCPCVHNLVMDNWRTLADYYLPSIMSCTAHPT